MNGQLENDKVVAVGEICLDYYYTRDNKEKQKELFERMIALAEKHDLPVIVHSRKSMQDTFDILKAHVWRDPCTAIRVRLKWQGNSLS